MNIYLLVTLLILFFCLYLWIGKKASAKIKTSNDFFLMARGLTFFPLTMTLFATMLGGGVLVGAAQAAYSNGLAVIVYPFGTLLGFLILGLGFGAKLRKLNIKPIPEIFESVYQSQTLRSVAATISTISLFSILVGQGIAIKSFFVTAGITHPILFFFFWVAFVSYTTMGGFNAVVKTDVIQAIFILIGLLIALISLDFKQITTAIQSTGSMMSEDLPWSSWFLMPLCFILIGQDMGQRCFATKDAKIIAPAAFIAGLFLLFGSGVAILFGLLANTLKIESASGSNILISSVIELTPPVVSTLFSAVIIMAIASTVDSLLCSISSNICYDFSFIRRMLPQKKIVLSRCVTFILGISTLIFIVLFDNVVDALMFSYELSISILFISIVIGVLFKNPSKNASVASMFGGVLGLLIFRLINTDYPKELMTLIVSLFFYIFVFAIEKRRSLFNLQGALRNE